MYTPNRKLTKAQERQRKKELQILHECRRKVNEAAEACNSIYHFAEGAQKIVEIFKGVPFHIWQRYDDQCWRDSGFWLARRVRNHPNWAPKLFEGLKS